jgi:hypothetical protein
MRGDLKPRQRAYCLHATGRPKISSHAEAAAADRAYYQSLTPQQRIDILLDLIASQRGSDEASQQVAKVCRIVTLQRR